MESTTPGSPDEREPVEFVVDLPHLSRVQNALEKLDVKYEKVEEDDGLKLALLRLTDPAKDVLPLRYNADLVTSAVLARVVSGLPGTPIPDLDLVMFAVRNQFAGQYGGWTPTIGKNRLIGAVEGAPHIGGGGVGDPKQLTNPAHLAHLKAALSGTFHENSGTAGQVRVGILDTAIVKRPELTERLANPGDAIANPRSPAPSLQGHGTFVAGLIAQRAPNAKLEVRSVLSNENATARVWTVARKMAEFVKLDVKVLNMSFVCATGDGQPPLVLTRAVELLRPRIVLVAAAGNHGSIKPDPANAGAEQQLTPKAAMWPGAFDDVYAVGADTRDRAPADFTPDLPWVDFMAPGEDVESTYLSGQVKLFHQCNELKEFNGYAMWSGTSFAAATVSGEIARRAGNGENVEEATAALRDAPHGDIRPFILSDEMK